MNKADPLKKGNPRKKGRGQTLEEQQELKRKLNERRVERFRKNRKEINIRNKNRKGPQGVLRKSEKRIGQIENLSAGGVVKKVASSLINKYKPKIKNEKEVYSKQDYSDVIKNYEKTQQRKKRNRAAAVIGGAATAVTVQSKKDKENKK